MIADLYVVLYDCDDAGTRGVIDISNVGPVYCDNIKHGGGWVFQRRFNGSVDFYRDWEDYKNGFGDMEGEFWLGLEKLHKLTSSGQYMLRIDLEVLANNITYMTYSKFIIGDESSGYRIDIGGYLGDAGDGMSSDNGMKFSTKDRDNDYSPNNCATKDKGAWWFNDCIGMIDDYSNGPGVFNSLKSIEMMVQKL